MSDIDTHDQNLKSQYNETNLPVIDGGKGPNLIEVLREDVIRDLQGQLRLARLYLSIPDPSPKDFQTVRPLPDPWWIQRPDGNLLFVIYCLNRPVEIRPGVSAILIEGRENLVLAIKALINIVREGRLDRALVHS
jgi:hypothetical protein